MPQSTHDRAAELHNLAAHAHTAAAVAHRKGDYLTAHELTKQAHDHSMNAQKIAEKLAFENERDGSMTDHGKPAFVLADFLAKAGLGRTIVQLKPQHALFSQGGPADSVFYLQKGRAKLSVMSKKGKEATITLLGAGDFAGEESLAGMGVCAWQRPPPSPPAPP